jgi:uncharacterized membrane protein
VKKRILSPKWKKWLVALHVLCMVVWFGGTLSLLTLNIVSTRVGSLPELTVTDQNLHVIDEIFIKFPAMGTLVTGLLLAILTNWGLTNYYWVILKEIVTVAIIPWSAEITSQIAAQGWDAVQSPIYLLTRSKVMNGAILNSLGLTLTVLVTYLKPWGKRRL